VSEGGPSQLVSSLHYLPKLFRVTFYFQFIDYFGFLHDSFLFIVSGYLGCTC
jgi:hypothetical protein